MKWVICIVFCTSVVSAQSPQTGAAQGAERRAFHAKQSKLREEGNDDLAKEQARSKGDLCADADRGGNSQIAQCLADRGKVTEQNYLAYIRTIGGLLRLQATGGPAGLPQKRLAFDAAEDAWQKYRDQSCASMTVPHATGLRLTVK
jgi:hypothetical protein